MPTAAGGVCAGPECATASTQPEGRLLTGALYGAVVAVICGVLWAVLGIFSGREFAYAAWGIGAAVGWAVHAGCRSASARAGMVAALLAFGALAIGKVVYVEHYRGKAIEIASDFSCAEVFHGGAHPERMTPEMLADYQLLQEYESGETEDAFARLKNQDGEIGDLEYSELLDGTREAHRRNVEVRSRKLAALPEAELSLVQKNTVREIMTIALGEEMIADGRIREGDPITYRRASRQLAVLSEAERTALAERIYGMLRSSEVPDRWESVRESCSAFDLLWLALAVGTAWMLAAKDRGKSADRPA